MRTLSARPWPTTFAVTLAPLSASPTLMPSPSPSMSTLSNVISLPASCSPSSSTRSVSPFITRYCLPPVTRTAYMIAFPDFVDLLVVLLWLPAIEGGQKRNCRGFRGLGSTAPCRRAPLWERLQLRARASAPALQGTDRKSTRLNSSHYCHSRMPPPA